jgi:selenocysteine lyase/cysteine desulfurase
MKTNDTIAQTIPEKSNPDSRQNPEKQINIADTAFNELTTAILAALETYSNVHRGSGHFSQVTTHLYEKAREIVLEYLGFKKNAYTVIFGSTLRLFLFSKVLKPGSCKLLRSNDFGLNLGVSALAIRKNALPQGAPFESGGGNTRLYGADWVMWAGYPEKFEAGTPAIINIIAFAKALKIIRKYGHDTFQNPDPLPIEAAEILELSQKASKTGKELLDEMRHSFPGKDVRVPTTAGPAAFVNFDSSASTPAFGPAAEAFVQMLQQPEAVREEVVREVRKISANFLNVPEAEYDLLFTSGTTESINIVARSENLASDGNIEPVILTSILEHSSNDLPWRNVSGATVIRLATDKEGFFDLEELELLLRNYNVEHRHGKKRIRMVALCGASNVLGTCNNLYAAGKLAKKYGALLLVDAAQLVAHRKIDMQSMNADFLVFSGHKMYAPFGAGVLVARKGLLHYEADEMVRIKTSGEENAGGIAALGSAMIILQRIGFDLIEEQERKVTAKVMNGLSSLPDVTIYGITDTGSFRFRQKTGVIAFDVKNRMAGSIARKLAYEGGIGIRFGCHCAHLIVKHVLNFSPAQEAIQKLVLRLLPFITLQGMSRVSFGLHNTEQDTDRLIDMLRQIILKTEYNKEPEDRKTTRPEAKYTAKEVKQQISEFIDNREMLVYE